MAKLFELSGSESTRKVCARMEIIARTSRARAKRLADLDAQSGIFETCKQARPQRRKYHNTLFREQMGTTGTTITTKHAPSGRAIVCRTKIY